MMAGNAGHGLTFGIEELVRDMINISLVGRAVRKTKDNSTTKFELFFLELKVHNLKCIH
jgi:hypothetical protein